MQKLLIGFLALGSILSAYASNLECKSLSQKAALAVGKANSGSVMKLYSIKELSVVDSEYSTKTYIFEVYLEDPKTNSMDGYLVTAESFSEDKGCLVKKVEMFQYD